MKELIPSLFLAQLAFALTVASPGPANISTALTSLTEGRAAGLLFATGVVSVSLILALFAAFGVSAALSASVWVGVPLKLASGAYMFWMASKSLRAFRAGASPLAGRKAERQPNLARYFLAGAAIHAINPKAIFGWMALMSLGTPADAPNWWAWVVLAALYPLSVFIMMGYALAFSTREAVAIYERRSRIINAIAAAIFTALAGYLIWSALSQLIA